uniref:Tetratricopeptide repeat domain 21A n=1 Tax=Electrophorus electricus TaxID=8005 RepID=A0AAY5F632_ELEEL
AINTALRFLKTYINDPVLLFFKAFGTLNEGRIQEAIRELHQLRYKPQICLCSVMALLCAYRQNKITDREAISELDSCLKMTRRTAEDKALYYGALLYWILGQNEKAREYIEKMLKLSNTSSQVCTTGWIALTSKNDVERSHAVRYFDDGLRDSKDVFGLMGKIEYFKLRQNEYRALDMVNQIIASYPDFIPALHLKMNIFMSLYNWEQTAEVAKRILEVDAHSLKALQMMTIISAAKDGDMRKYLHHLLSAVEVTEPSTPSLHVELTMPISRVVRYRLRSVSRAPGDAALVSELGYFFTLQYRYKEALRWYTKALNMDPGSRPALEECQTMMSFTTVQMTLLQAMVAQKKGVDHDKVAGLLKKAVDFHLQTLQGLPHGVDYLQRLDIIFLLQVVNMHLASSQPLPFGLKHSNMILKAVIKAAPGLLASCYYMAHVKFLTGMCHQLQLTSHIKVLGNSELTMPEMHLLQAKLYLHAGDHSKCLSSLESGVSHNFEVSHRTMPQYNLIKARALKGSGKLVEAIQCLRMVMSMSGVRMLTEGQDPPVTQSERVSVFLELADTLRLNGEQSEATKVMQDAIWQFKETSEEIRVLVANVDLALSKDDVDTAFNILKNIKPGKHSYTKAKEQIAHIYLEKLRNKKLYIACYREICEQLPGPHSYVLLADAFMKIQEPEKAIEVYQEAVQMAPKDAMFAKKIGQALVKTHQYDKAVNYYETVLSTSPQYCVCLELTALLLKLKHFERAQQILERALDHKDCMEQTTMMNDVKLLRVLVKVFSARNELFLHCDNPPLQIYDLQQKILRQLPFEQPKSRDEQRRVTAAVCCDQAQEYCRSGDLERAQQCYSEALTYCPEDTEASLYYEHHKLDFCEDHCLKILKHDKNHTATTMLLADVRFRKNQKEAAIKLYTDIIHQHPDNFRALASLLHMLRRVGRLDDVLLFFKTCESYSPTTVTEPGYNYCKGLYYWHTYYVREALLYLSKARRDSEWAEEALELMMHICLNPDKKTFGGEVFGADCAVMVKNSNSNYFASIVHKYTTSYLPLPACP